MQINPGKNEIIISMLNGINGLAQGKILIEEARVTLGYTLTTFDNIGKIGRVSVAEVAKDPRSYRINMFRHEVHGFLIGY
jgi:hypothetical protein